ncbi:MAG: hypothetical protein ACOX51_06550 [Myxococcota bacterium]|nr:hypothetical protein [Myxococcota bacterium]MBP8970001.1 hypothetical protein [Myxococcota bacterium]HHW95912.1 hypothetical protein [Oligoflexales bacterium]HQL56680.1 hypothetical protein [Myxococcota bacterium]
MLTIPSVLPVLQSKVSSFSFLSILLPVAFIAIPFPAHAYRSVIGYAPPVYVEYLSIPQGSSVIFQTTNLSSGGDPVLHLLRSNGAGGYTQVAYNDNYNGLNARIAYYNSSSITEFVLLLRSYDTDFFSTCDLMKNGVIHQASVPVRGWFEPGSSFTYAAGDQVRTVLRPGASEAPFVAKFSSRSKITGLALGNATAGTSVLSISGNETYFLVGTPYVRDGDSYTQLRSGLLLLIFNDIATDSDGDGLGDSLEAELGTCATATGCPRTPHGRDTDRDGLEDGEEVLGVPGTLGSGIDDLAFSRYGANPRQKDIFVEVDYLTDLRSSVVPLGENPFQWIRINPNSSIWNGTLETWVNKAREPFLAAPADHVRNPNNQNGVELHLDLGVAPLDSADERKFGNWSTGAARGLVPNFIIECSGPVNGMVSVTINDVTKSFDATSLTPEGIAFNILLAAFFTLQPVTGVSSTVAPDGTTTLVLEAATPGVHFTRSLTVPTGYEDALKVLAEDNDSLRNHYDGTVQGGDEGGGDHRQVDVVRRGRMRYAIITNIGGGGQADGPKFVTGLGHSAFVHELGHTLGLQHHGHSAWGNSGVNCIPHYDSVMRYASAPYKFSKSDDGYALNPARIAETDTFGPDSGFNQTMFSQSPWNYPISTTSETTTDWNRDGLISGSSYQWRTMALSLYNGSCNAFSLRRERIEPGTTFVGPVDLVRFGSRLYAFWATGTELKYKYATLGPISNKSCTGSAGFTGDQCLTWSQTRSLTANGTDYQGVTTYAFNNRIFVGYNQANGVIRVEEYSVGSNGILIHQSGQRLGYGADYYLSNFTPELVEWHKGNDPAPLALLYLSTNGYYCGFVKGANTWGFIGVMVDTNENAIEGGQAPVAKAWPESAAQGWSASEKRTLAIFPSSASEMRLYVLDHAMYRWQLTNVETAWPTHGKPFLEYRMIHRSSGASVGDSRGHFMVGQMRNNNWGNIAYFRLSTLVNRTYPPHASSLGLLSVGDFLQNLWAATIPGSSLSLYSDSTLGNVFGLVPLNAGNEVGLYFYPHADGAPDATYTVYSDFRVMEDYICKTIGDHRGFNCGAVYVLD